MQNFLFLILGFGNFLDLCKGQDLNSIRNILNLFQLLGII